MSEIRRFRPEDRPAVDALYRRVWGDEAAEAFHARWEWMYPGNPRMPGDEPLIWVSHDGPDVVGVLHSMPVRLSVRGVDVDAVWGTDAMVASEQRGKGLGERLYAVWRHAASAAIAINMTDASQALLRKMGFPSFGTVPRFAKPVSANAYAQWKAHPPSPVRRVAAWWRRRAARRRGGERVRPITRFDARFTRLWERAAPKFALAVRRDAEYLQWRYLEAPQVRYHAIEVTRRGETVGWATYRHAQDGPWRVTMLVDFVTDPEDGGALDALLDAVEGAARADRSDFLRAYVLHAGYQARLREAGFVAGTTGHRFVVEIRDTALPADYYTAMDTWHITRGDSDSDR